jgi:hypothetical protein
MSTEFEFVGEIISESGLQTVAESLHGCSWPVELRHSSFTHSFYLRSGRGQAEISLEMDSGQGRRHLFSGGVVGSLERTESLLWDFSRCLTMGGFVHRIEVYDESNSLVAYLHYGWPKEKHDPPAR